VNSISGGRRRKDASRIIRCSCGARCGSSDNRDARNDIIASLAGKILDKVGAERMRFDFHNIAGGLTSPTASMEEVRDPHNRENESSNARGAVMLEIDELKDEVEATMTGVSWKSRSDDKGPVQRCESCYSE